MRGEHGLGGEKRHLRVIGDGAQFSISGSVIAYALFTIGANNFVKIEKFNWRAEGVADGAAEQASAESVLQAGIGWSSGKGHFCLEP